MPELPEVELVARSLDRLVSKQRIIKAEILRDRLSPYHSPDDFADKIKNSQIERVARRGKFVLFFLDSAQILLTHLRMTGRFMLHRGDERELPKHSHAVFYFAENCKLIFQDQRHFGMMNLIDSNQLNETKELKCLAPEPFSNEFSSKYFQTSLSTSKRSVKEFLLDQTKVCGLGNIYAAEALFLAGVNPQTAANQISANKAKRLFETIRFVLAESIEHGSTLNVDPENIDGSYYGGNYEGHWRVYGREGNSCSACQTQINRIVQGARSTFYCPKCQRK